MGWRDQLRPASFREVPFEVMELAGELGRRVVADEVPETDRLPPTEDLGRKRPRYRLRGFVAGRDVLDRRDALLAALDTPGPGELVHPWRGRLFVQIGDVSYEHDEGGGFCAIDFDAFLHGGPPLPYVAPIAAPTVAAEAAAASAAIVAVGDRVDLSLLGSYAGLVGELLGLEGIDLLGMLGVDPDLAGEVAYSEGWSAAAVRIITTLSDSVDDLLAFARRRARPLASSGSPAEARAVAAHTTITHTMRTLCLVRACELAAAATYASADGAEDVLAQLAAALTDELALEPDPDACARLIDLHAAMVTALADLADRLPRLRTIVVPVPRSTILIAFDRLDATTLGELEQREREVVALNRIGHPGFVTGPIQVLGR